MKSTAIRTALTILLACGVAPALGAYFLALLEGHGGAEFWIAESGMIPVWLFAIPFVLPFTVPAAVLLSLGSAWFSRKQWTFNMNRALSFIVLGLVSSLFYPAFMTAVSRGSTFDAPKYGVTQHDQSIFLAEHWIAASVTGILGGLLLSFIWGTKQRKGNANKAIEAIGDPGSPQPHG